MSDLINASGEVKSIIIVGGGLSGWMTAMYLNHYYNQQQHHIKITLIDRLDNANIGIGEASLPSIRFFFAAMGLDENELLRETNATIKSGILFKHWQQANSNEPHQFFHPYDHVKLAPGMDMATHWLLNQCQNIQRFDQGTSISSHLMTHGQTPKTASCHAYEGVVPYGYHFDATLMFRYLRKKAVAAGVEHIETHVNKVNCHQQNIIGVVTELGELTADFYIDCTGAKGLLMSALDTSNWQSLADKFSCNQAIVKQVAYQENEVPKTYTQVTAMKYGWAWQIDLVNRKGIGYVFDNRFISDDQAEKELLSLIDEQAQVLKSHQLSMSLGMRNQHWQGNCVAIGLSGSLLDPLEATGLHLVHTGVSLLATHLSSSTINPSTVAAYNRAMQIECKALIAFIDIHYRLCNRDDTPFWQQNSVQPKKSADTENLIHLWQHKVCEQADLLSFTSNTFSEDDYRFILYGMLHFPQLKIPVNKESSEQIFVKFENKVSQMLKDTLSHKDFLQQLHDMPLAEIAQLWSSR